MRQSVKDERVGGFLRVQDETKISLNGFLYIFIPCFLFMFCFTRSVIHFLNCEVTFMNLYCLS